MTAEELINYLIKYSPFKFKGDSTDKFNFTATTFQINNGKHANYEITKNDNDFIFQETGGLIPVFINIKIDIPNLKGFPVRVNFDEQRLKNDLYRNSDAQEGYFIFTPV